MERRSVLDGAVDPVDAVARAIERHVRARPHASDTLEGVRDWWLGGLDPVPLTLVQAALDRLVADGVVSLRRIPGGVVYGGA